MSVVAVQDLFESLFGEFDVCAQPAHEKQRHTPANKSIGLRPRRTHGPSLILLCTENLLVGRIRATLSLPALHVQIVSRAGPTLNTVLYRGAVQAKSGDSVIFLVDPTRTEALQSRDSIPAAAAVPRFLLRSK